MGVVRQGIARGALRLAALAAGAAASIIVARKLSVTDYAVYQSVIKRVDQYASLPTVITGYWSYRYAAMNIKGSISAHMVSSLAAASIAAAAAALLTEYMGGGLPLAVLLSLGMALWMVYAALKHALTALRPVYSEAASLAQRMLYTLLVVALVYLSAWGGAGAAAALTASAAAGLAVLVKGGWKWLREGPCWRCLREWAKGAWIPLAGWLASFVAALDVLVVHELSGDYPVAAFFAVTAAASVAFEALAAAVTHVQAHVLRTGDALSPLALVRLLSLAGALAYGYAIARPEQVVAFMNPVYTMAAPALRLYAVSALISLHASTLNQVLTGLDRSRADRPGRLVKGAAAASLAASATYLLLLMALLLSLRLRGADAVLAWVAARLASSVTLYSTLLLLAEPGTFRAAALSSLGSSLGYLALAAALAYAIAPTGYEPRFTDNLILALKGFLPTAALYAAAVLALDGWARSVTRAALRSWRGIRA